MHLWYVAILIFAGAITFFLEIEKGFCRLL
jgi:hypothetical protein